MSYEFGGSLYRTQQDRDNAAFAEWITAGGINSPAWVASWLGQSSDEDLAAEASNDWPLDGANYLAAARAFRIAFTE